VNGVAETTKTASANVMTNVVAMTSVIRARRIRHVRRVAVVVAAAGTTDSIGSASINLGYEHIAPQPSAGWSTTVLAKQGSRFSLRSTTYFAYNL
jgi:hypothetical protein